MLYVGKAHYSKYLSMNISLCTVKQESLYVRSALRFSRFACSNSFEPLSIWSQNTVFGAKWGVIVNSISNTIVVNIHQILYRWCMHYMPRKKIQITFEIVDVFLKFLEDMVFRCQDGFDSHNTEFTNETFSDYWWIFKIKL